MTEQTLITIVATVCALLGGLFGQKLLDRWFDRERDKAKASGAQEEREFADNEQARRWLSEQLTERDRELQAVRASERELLKQVGDLAAQVARQEERTNAQTIRIDELSATVARLGADYAEMKAERDEYRAQKHQIENRLTAESLGRQIAEKNLESATREIERLKGEIAALTKTGRADS